MTKTSPLLTRYIERLLDTIDKLEIRSKCADLLISHYL